MGRVCGVAQGAEQAAPGQHQELHPPAGSILALAARACQLLGGLGEVQQDARLFSFLEGSAAAQAALMFDALSQHDTKSTCLAEHLCKHACTYVHTGTSASGLTRTDAEPINAQCSRPHLLVDLGKVRCCCLHLSLGHHGAVDAVGVALLCKAHRHLQAARS